MAAPSDIKENAAAPLSEVMLAMDVVDTLRHRQDLVARELAGENRKSNLVERLRKIYREQGIEVPEYILLEGVTALEEDRFVYQPSGSGFKRKLAQIYVSRARWGKWLMGATLSLVLAFGGYFAVYVPYQANRAETARIELTQKMPAQMQELYDTIFAETKVQSPVAKARELLERGQTASKEGDRATAERALAGLTKIRDQLRMVYTLKVVNRDGVQSGFWTFPEINRDATNYYIVVEAIGPEGKALTIPIENQETGLVEDVQMWGLRVPESVYNSIGADKRDDGIIQRNVVGQKEFGFFDVKYAIPVSGGAVTRW